MFEFLSSREIASLLYIALFLFFVAFQVVIKKNIQHSVIKLIKTACSIQILVPYILLLLYAFFLVLGMTHLSFWRWAYLKDIVIWVLFVGIPICFNSVNIKPGEHYFSKILGDNLKLSVFLEFFINTFTFHLIVEFVIQGLLIFLSLLYAVSKTNDRYISVKKLLDVLLAITGIVLFFQTLRIAINTYPNYDIENWIVTFLIPIVFSLLYIPAAYIIALYAKYQLLFIRVHSQIAENITPCFIKIIWSCGLSLNNIALFQKVWARHVYKPISKKDFDSIITVYKAQKFIYSCDS